MRIYHRDTVLGINMNLVIGQQLDFDTFTQIVALHKLRYDINQLLAATKDKTLMRIIFVQLRDIEFELQLLWGFEPIESYHKSFLWPHCTCPKWDNLEMYPHYQIKSAGCPLHGADVIIPEQV